MGKWYKPKTWVDAGKKAYNYAKDTAEKSFQYSVVNPFKAGGHLLQAGGYAVQGKFEKAEHKLDKAAGEFTSSVFNDITGGFVPGVSEKAGQAASAATAYGLMNWKRGTGYAEDLTGHDIDNSEARAYNKAVMEATLEAERQEAQRAEEMADNQRRASLYALRRQVGAVNVGVRSSVFGGGSGDKEKTATGVVLG